MHSLQCTKLESGLVQLSRLTEKLASKQDSNSSSADPSNSTGDIGLLELGVGK